MLLNLRNFGLALIVLLFGYAINNAIASDASIIKIQPVVRNDKLYLDTDVKLEVNSSLRNVAIKGVPIYFTADAEIKQKRWYWTDKIVIADQITWRIAYNALTRQWRVSNGSLSLPEASFDDAVSRIEHIRDWQLALVEQFDEDTEYYGRVKLRLDTSMLARPFQIDALNSSAWVLSTAWENFSFSIKNLTSH